MLIRDILEESEKKVFRNKGSAMGLKKKGNL